MDTVRTGQNNSLHHCITDKKWYIHLVTLYTQQYLKYRSLVKEKRNINVYLFYIPNFQILI